VPVDRDRLIKLLNMTGSSHDSEALSAIRLSNELLRQTETTWADLLALPTESGRQIAPEAKTADAPAPARDYTPENDYDPYYVDDSDYTGTHARVLKWSVAIFLGIITAVFWLRLAHEITKQFGFNLY